MIPSIALATSTEQPTSSLLPLGKALPEQALISQGYSVILINLGEYFIVQSR